MEQLNRLPSQKVQMKLRPAVIPFASDVELSVTRTNTLYGLVSLDDSGLKSTGKLQWNLELGLDQPFQQGDRLQIDLTGDGTRSGTEKGTRGQSVSYSFPSKNRNFIWAPIWEPSTVPVPICWWGTP